MRVKPITYPSGLVIMHCKKFSVESSLLRKGTQTLRGFMTVIIDALSNTFRLNTWCAAHVFLFLNCSLP